MSDVYDGAVERLWEDGEPLEVEYRLLGSEGEELWVLDRMHPEPRGEDGSLLVSGVVADISERKRVEAEAREKLAHAALHDSLTGLANRASFLEHLELGLRRATRNGTGIALLFIDLDNFKQVNDSFGHAVGDDLLKAVGSRLHAAVRANDVVARQGGDEFLILLSDIGNPASEVVASKIQLALREPFVVDEIELQVSASIGIGLYPVDGADAEALLKHADTAMYSVKETGRDGYARYGDGARDHARLAARSRPAAASSRSSRSE